MVRRTRVMANIAEALIQKSPPFDKGGGGGIYANE
jgi:hypothetical protein